MKRIRVPLWLAFFPSPGFFVLGIYSVIAYPEGGFFPVLGFLLCIAGAGVSLVMGLAGAMDRASVNIPIPYPDRQQQLERRLKRVVDTKWEVTTAIENLPQDGVYGDTLKLRHQELDTAMKVLKMEMVHRKLSLLDGKANRIVRNELKLAHKELKKG